MRKSDLLIVVLDSQDLEIHLLTELNDDLRAFSTRSSESSEMWQSPSRPSPSSTNTPKLVNRETLPRTISPGRWVATKPSHALGVRSFIESERRWPRAIDVGDDRVDFLILLQKFLRMLELLRPRDVRNVDQTVDAFFKLDERTEVGKVADLAVDLRADRVTDRRPCPTDFPEAASCRG